MPSNCPAISQGYSKGCRDAQGGDYMFYITEHANLDQDTYVEASWVVTTLNLTAGRYFWPIEQELNTGNHQEVPTPNRQAGTTFVDQTVNMSLLKRSASLSYWIRALAHQDVVIIAVEQTGTAFLLGRKNGLALEPSTSTSGVNMGDKNGYDLIFKGMEPTMAPTISQSIIDLLLQ